MLRLTIGKTGKIGGGSRASDEIQSSRAEIRSIGRNAFIRVEQTIRVPSKKKAGWRNRFKLGTGRVRLRVVSDGWRSWGSSIHFLPSVAISSSVSLAQLGHDDLQLLHDRFARCLALRLHDVDARCLEGM